MSFGPLPLEGYLDRLASKEPTPGGGTASAVAGATACALGEMVVGLTLGKEKFASVEAQLAPLVAEFRELRDEFLRLADRDSAAYETYMAAARLPKASPAEQAARKDAMQRAAAGAAHVPLLTAQAAVETLHRLALVARLGNPNARSDAVVGALHAWTAFQGARLNVLANLDGLGDAAKAAELQSEVDRLAKEAEGLFADLPGLPGREPKLS